MEGDSFKDDEEEGFVSETLASVFGFFGLTLFNLEVEGCFNPNEVCSIPTKIWTAGKIYKCFSIEYYLFKLL